MIRKLIARLPVYIVACVSSSGIRKPSGTVGGRCSRRLSLRATLHIVCGLSGVVWGEHPRSEVFTIAPEPEWVRPVAVADLPPESDAARDAMSDGARHVIVDNQLRLGPTNVHYLHFARRFLTEAGVNDQSTVEVKFDPSFQMLRFHRLCLWRGTNRIERLRAGAFRALQREESLEWRMLDGRLSVVAQPEDVRVGDVLEVAYTIDGDNPVFGGRCVTSFLLGWATPVVRQRLRIVSPSSRWLGWRLHGGAGPPLVFDKGGLCERLWDLTNTPAVQIENVLPLWYRPLPEVTLSEYSSWREVAQWAIAEYAAPPAPETMIPLLATWRALDTDEARVCAALGFVQNEIRYLGLELGANSHRPNPPALVLERRFGDCKDKALLLSTLLRSLGCDAAPALVHSSLREAVTNELPSPNAFDHVIVRVRFGGRTEWVDPTAAHQRGGLADHSLPAYGHALVVTPGTDGFVPVERPHAAPSATRIVERYVLPAYGKPASLVARTVYTGRDAERTRAGLANTPRQAIEKQYLNYYAQRYPGIVADGDVQVLDPPESNELVVTERYRIQDIWKPDQTDARRLACTFRAQDLEAYAFIPTTVIRTMPLGLQYPADIHQTIEVRLPEEWAVRTERESIVTDGVRFDSSVRYGNRLLTLDYRLRTLNDAIPVDRCAAHIEKVRRIRDSLSYSVSFPHPDRSKQVGTFAQFNWPPAVSAALFTAVLIAGAALLYRRRTPAPAPCACDGPSGLGGWLILVFIGLCGRVVMRTKLLFELGYVFNRESWVALTQPTGSAYNVFWAPVLMVELHAALLILVLSVVQIVFFFQRRAAFPKLMILLLLLDLAVAGVDWLLGIQIPAVVDVSGAKMQQGTWQAFIVVCIWWPYFVSSRRVRLTFTRWTNGRHTPPPLPPVHPG
ncbi:MAG: DUF3857 domain-containing protein [Kiritimatiellae bacterium]|nr:DUF3857 domain-containing protein [Kiritimatiellia bacterium]